MLVDLHLHSVCSDGILKPQEIIDLSRLKERKIISITDHNSIDAYKNKLIYPKDIHVITGIEIDSTIMDDEVHVLGYNFDINNKLLNKMIANIQKSKIMATKKLISYLTIHHINIDYRKLILNNNNITYDYLCGLIIEYSNYKTIQEINDELFMKNDICVQHPPIDEIVFVLKQAGGFSILAHPIRLNKNEKKSLKSINKALELGIQGLECFYPLNNKNFTRHCIDLCKKNNLYITGGSDSHSFYFNFNVKYEQLNLPVFTGDNI